MWFLEYEVHKHLISVLWNVMNYRQESPLRSSYSGCRGKFPPCDGIQIFHVHCSCFQSHKCSLQHHTQWQIWSCFCACHEGIQANSGILPCILNLSTKWKWFIKFMAQWVDSRYDLDAWEKSKISCSCQKLNNSWKYTYSFYTSYDVLLLSHSTVGNMTAVELYTLWKGLIHTFSCNVAAPVHLIQ